MNRACNMAVTVYLVIIIIVAGYCIVGTPSQGIYHAVDWIQYHSDPAEMNDTEVVRLGEFIAKCESAVLAEGSTTKKLYEGEME